MSHNRSFFAVELANREESVQFQTVSLCCHGTFSFCPTLIPCPLLNSAKLKMSCGTRNLVRLDNTPLFVWAWHKWDNLGMLCTLAAYMLTQNAHRNASRCLSELHPFSDEFTTPNIFFFSVLCRKTWKLPNMFVGCVWPDSSSTRLTRVTCKCPWF